MLVHYLSDVHNDYHDFNALTTWTGNKNDVLVIAGDINSKGRTVADVDEVADRWKAIIVVPGNHDWWGLAIHERHKFISEKPNVHFLLEDHVKIDDVVFCGTTLWHEVDGPLNEMDWKYCMMDAKKIRGPNWTHLQGWDIHNEHLKGIRFIEDCHRMFSGKKVLITHHALSNQSIDPKRAGQSSNKFYVTHRPDLLEGFVAHIHGHVHQEFDYVVNGCNVCCNPRAYGSENPDFGIRILEIE